MYRCRAEELYGIVGVSSIQLAGMQRTTTREQQKEKKKKKRPLFLSHPTGTHSMFLIRTQLVLRSYWRFGGTAEMSFCPPEQNRSSYGRPEETEWSWWPDACFLKEEGSKGVVSLPLAEPDANCTPRITLRTACSGWVPIRSTAGPSLVSHQTDRRTWCLLFRKGSLGKHQARENIPKSLLRKAIGEQNTNLSWSCVAGCVGVWEPASRLDERSCSPWGDTSTGVVITVWFPRHCMQIIFVQQSELQPGCSVGNTEPKLSSLGMTECLLENRKCVTEKGRDRFWGKVSLRDPK